MGNLRVAFRRLPLFILVAANLIAAAHLAVIAARTETGWETIAASWRGALSGWMWSARGSIGEREPVEQAEFWLAEIDRILAEHPDSAAMHMGAAWVLDSPDVAFMQHHLRERARPLSLLAPFELNETSIEAAKTQFRAASLERCRELARRATNLAPEEQHWWRLRALLEFEGDTFDSGAEFGPREGDWLATLDECARHDPENALYDYLAAYGLWEQSASYKWPDNPMLPERWQVTIDNQQQFALGEERFARAQQKPVLAFGQPGLAAMVDLLEASDASRVEQANTAARRLFSIRVATLLLYFQRWQMARADDALQENLPGEEVERTRETLRLFDQYAAAEEADALEMRYKWDGVSRRTYGRLVQSLADYPGILADSEIELLKAQEEARRVEVAALAIGWQRLPITQASRTPPYYAAIFTIVAAASCEALLVVGSPLLVLGWLLERRGTESDAGIGFWRQTIAWTAGCGLTFLLLGMAPAEIISREAQSMAFRGVCWAMALGVVVWLGVGLYRRRRFRFSLLTLLLVVAGLALIAAVLPVVDWFLALVAVQPAELWMPARGWAGLSAEALRSTLRMSLGSWKWAVLLWLAHGAFLIGLGVSMLFAVLWYMRRQARQSGETFARYWAGEPRSRWSALARFAGRTACVAALVWLLVYCLVAPEVLRATEADYQFKIGYYRDPGAVYQRIRAAQAAVESSAGEMQAIRERVREEVFGEVDE